MPVAWPAERAAAADATIYCSAIALSHHCCMCQHASGCCVLPAAKYTSYKLPSGQWPAVAWVKLLSQCLVAANTPCRGSAPGYIYLTGLRLVRCMPAGMPAPPSHTAAAATEQNTRVQQCNAWELQHSSAVHSTAQDGLVDCTAAHCRQWSQLSCSCVAGVALPLWYSLSAQTTPP